ncbi:hypothetical protein BASA81_003655 [Batrachochytrium salamandrivorans]|nr:hypothetical protein BASA81_003655 [Batrachochytrium salamandrivorans]
MSTRLLVDSLLAQGKTREAANALSDWGASCSDLVQARALLIEALSICPSHFESQANLALMDLEDAGKATGEKIKSFQLAVQLNPTWFDGVKTLASLLDDDGRELESIAQYRLAVELEPRNCEVALDLVLVQAKSGNLNQAIEQCKLALRIDSRSAKGNLLLGELLWRSGASPKQAVVFCERALEFASPEDHLLRLNVCLVVATALEQQGLLQQAIAYLETACRLPPVVDTTNARIRLNALRFAATAAAPGEGSNPSVLEGVRPLREDDAVGSALLCALSGGSPSLPSQAQHYSQLSEQFLLNCHFPDSHGLIHKVSLYRNTQAINPHVLPRSTICKRWQDVVLEPGVLYFLKNPAVQRGQGILLARSESTLPEHLQAFFPPSPGAGQEFLLQEAVHPPLLMMPGGYKFGLRTHALLVQFPHQRCRSVFVFRESILTRCWSPYDVVSTEALVHISSTSVQRNVLGFDRNQVKGLASVMFASEYAQVLRRLKPKLFDCFRACFSPVTRPTAVPMLQLFGFDSMVRDGDLEPFVAEANASPQFQDAKRTEEMLAGFALPMTHGASALVCQGFAHRQRGYGAENRDWEWVGDV